MDIAVRTKVAAVAAAMVFKVFICFYPYHVKLKFAEAYPALVLDPLRNQISQKTFALFVGCTGGALQKKPAHACAGLVGCLV